MIGIGYGARAGVGRGSLRRGCLAAGLPPAGARARAGLLPCRLCLRPACGAWRATDLVVRRAPRPGAVPSRPRPHRPPGARREPDPRRMCLTRAHPPEAPARVLSQVRPRICCSSGSPQSFPRTSRSTYSSVTAGLPPSESCLLSISLRSMPAAISARSFSITRPENPEKIHITNMLESEIPIVL